MKTKVSQDSSNGLFVREGRGGGITVRTNIHDKNLIFPKSVCFKSDSLLGGIMTVVPSGSTSSINDAFL